MIADPVEVARTWPDERVRVLAGLALVVSETPWTLARAQLTGLNDDEILHAVALSAYFGHLNRIADCVGVPLDYTVRHQPPHADPTTRALAPAPSVTVCAPTLELVRRTPTSAALRAWREHVFEREPTGRITARQRALLERRVGALLGRTVVTHERESDSRIEPTIDALLLILAEQITLAPWQLGDASFAALRSEGCDDATLFETCIIASTAGVDSRIAVALSALDVTR